MFAYLRQWLTDSRTPRRHSRERCKETVNWYNLTVFPTRSLAGTGSRGLSVWEAVLTVQGLGDLRRIATYELSASKTLEMSGAYISEFGLSDHFRRREFHELTA